MRKFAHKIQTSQCRGITLFAACGLAVFVIACGHSQGPELYVDAVSSSNCQELGQFAKAIEAVWNSPDPWPTYDSRKEVGSLVLAAPDETYAFTYGMSESQATHLGSAVEKCENLSGFLKVSKITSGSLMLFPYSKEPGGMESHAWYSCNHGETTVSSDAKRSNDLQQLCKSFGTDNFYSIWLPQSHSSASSNDKAQIAMTIRNIQGDVIEALATTFHETFHIFQDATWKNMELDEASEKRFSKVSEKVSGYNLTCSDSFNASLAREYKWWDAAFGFGSGSTYTRLKSNSPEDALRLANALLKIRHERADSDDCQYFYKVEETLEGTAQWVGALKAQRGIDDSFAGQMDMFNKMPDEWAFGRGPWYNIGVGICTLLDLLVPNHSWQLALVEGWTLQQTLEKAVELRSSSPGSEVDFAKIPLQLKRVPKVSR